MKIVLSLVIAVSSILPTVAATTEESAKGLENLQNIAIGSLVVQTREDTPAVSAVFAVLTKSIESKSATAGQQLILRTISDLTVNGEVLIPRGVNFVGRVKEVSTRNDDVPQSVLSVIVDKVSKNGLEIPVQAIIAAVAAPENDSLASDPTYGMMHSNEPKMAVSAGSATRSGGLSASSKVGSTAAVATAEIKGAMDQPLLLDANSQGAIGYKGLSISWQLTAPPAVTVFASKNRNVKLDAGTQVLLRMATPRVSR